MRPVRLDMHGFAAFREPAVVDFRGAEYFALVGPTGSGKSTVIDALTFALYGTVPRWDDRRAVALALAPSVIRGVVQLVFDVRGDRYIAVRELRRAARGGVNVKNARLERLLDREDLGGDTEVLAADSGVTKAVEELLGLPFEHFTACVVLPQGEFAEFLHAKPGDRQAILTRLLGLGVYERVAREANQEAGAAGHRAALLAEQLGAYADATDEAVAGADARVEALEDLNARVAALLPELAAAATAVADADAVVATLRSEQARLDALAVPDGIAALDGRRRAAQERVDDARRRFGDAETADDAARKLVADAPPRAPLERARRDHADLTSTESARPAAAAAQAAAAEAEQRAIGRVAAAERAASLAATAREAAVAAQVAARTDAERLQQERALLAGVRAPVNLAAAARRQAEAVVALEEASARASAADAADARARARLTAAPPRGPLEQAHRDHAALAAARSAQPAARDEHAAADRGRTAAAAAVAHARAALGAALAHRDAAARGDLAAALRPALVVGEPCPVCAQRVTALPPPLPGTHPAAHDDAAAAAQAGLEAALAAEADAVAAERQAAGERDRLAAEVTRLRTAVEVAAAGLAGSGLGGVGSDGAGWDGAGSDGAGSDGAGSDDAGLGGAGSDGGTAGPGRRSGGSLDGAEAVAAALAALDTHTAEAARSDAGAREARRGRDAAATVVAAVRQELAAAAGTLRAARDPLVALGAPDAADDPAAGWAALTVWAGTALAERVAALSGAEQVASATAAKATSAAAAAEEAAAALTACRRDETTAARAEQQARSRVEALDERAAALRAALAGAPVAERIDDDLAKLDALEAAARTADADLRAARAARAAAEEAVETVRREVAAGRDALRAARDPLVPLGAPAASTVDGDDLAASWEALVSWAARESAARAARTPGAAAAAAAARGAHETVGRRLADALAEEGVVVQESAARRRSVASEEGGVGPGPAGPVARGAGPGVTDPVSAAGGVGGRSGPAGPPEVRAPGDVTNGGTAEAAVAAALAGARAVRDRLAERRAEAAGKRAARAAAEEEQQVAKMLGGLLRSDRFPRWLVASALDALVADASAGLAQLSSGQFELTHEEGEFLVVDHADADARRPVKTLSGGETFQASLALALALSAQMSSLAAEGAARLDSIFLDEGFGTLDEANLEVVASTLENLASRGDRMVGVITHVPGLAERVPVRFVVRRDQRSARIEREGAE